MEQGKLHSDLLQLEYIDIDSDIDVDIDLDVDLDADLDADLYLRLDGRQDLDLATLVSSMKLVRYCYPYH